MWINLCGRGLIAWVRCCVIEIPLKATENKDKTGCLRCDIKKHTVTFFRKQSESVRLPYKYLLSLILNSNSLNSNST
jgi:hypothetical protein